MNTERALRAIDTRARRALAGEWPFFRQLYDDTRVGEGKRLRARLFFAFSGRCDTRAVETAAAIELLHAATLIHDDIIDRGRLRRGRLSLYAKWNIPMSVLYGDYLFSKSLMLVSGLQDRRILGEMLYAASEILKGEMYEQYRRGDVTLQKQQYLSIISKKSGALFGSACKLGAMTGGANRESATKAYRYGLNVGTAYQILDDCGDYVNLDRTKRGLSDIQRNIMTLPVIYLLGKIPVHKKKEIESILKKPLYDRADIRLILTLMKRYSAIAASLRSAKQFLISAHRILEHDPDFNPEGCREVLSWIGERIDHVEKKHCHSGRRICGNKRPPAPAGL
jgi:octaprenyl-diphosphate synthase